MMAGDADADLQKLLESHVAVEDEMPALENSDAEMEGEENGEQEEEEEASSISSLSEPYGGDGLGAGAVDPVDLAEIAGKANEPTNAASSCGQTGVPMNPGLAPLIPQLVPVPPPADLNDLSVFIGSRISCLHEDGFTLVWFKFSNLVAGTVPVRISMDSEYYHIITVYS
jgi:hypothetical protein